MSAMLRCGRAPRIVLSIAALLLAYACTSRAQSTSAKPAATPASPAPTTGTKTGFAIESEMLTYTAMDSQVSAVACGIARNVGTADDKCTPRSLSGPGAGIVIVASPSSALAEFQLWRADISSMKMLTQRANHYCAQHSPERGATPPPSLGSQILSLIPGGQALSFAQALLSSSSESNPVEGNIEDQTLVADVAGHLRSLGISVVIPDTYMPHSLTTVDDAHSPFLSNFATLLKAKDCLDATPNQKEADHNSQSDDQHGPPEGGKGPQPDAEKQSISQAIERIPEVSRRGAFCTSSHAGCRRTNSSASTGDLPPERRASCGWPRAGTRLCFRRQPVGRERHLVSALAQGAGIRWNVGENGQRHIGEQDQFQRRGGGSLLALPLERECGLLRSLLQLRRAHANESDCKVASRHRRTSSLGEAGGWLRSEPIAPFGLLLMNCGFPALAASDRQAYHASR